MTGVPLPVTGLTAVALAAVAGCASTPATHPHHGSRELGPRQACRYLADHSYSRAALLHVHRHHTNTQAGRSVGDAAGWAASRDHSQVTAGWFLLDPACNIHGIPEGTA